MNFNWISGLVDLLKKLFRIVTSTTTTSTTTVIVDPTIPTTTTTTTTQAGGLDEFAQAKIRTAPQEVASWPIISTLKVTNQGSLIRLEVDAATLSKWPRDTTINIHCLLFRDGQWQTGPCDAVRPLPSVKEYSCLCVPDGDNRLFVPEKGEKTGVVITTRCRNGQVTSNKFRSSIAWIVGR
jgi:hypothetical protein